MDREGGRLDWFLISEGVYEGGLGKRLQEGRRASHGKCISCLEELRYSYSMFQPECLLHLGQPEVDQEGGRGRGLRDEFNS